MDPTTSTKAAEETAKAVQEVAKTTGQGIQALREMAGYVAQLLGGPLEQAVAILEDRLRFIGWRQKVRLLAKARAFAAEHGLPEPTRRVPLSLLVPLLEAGAAEEDDELQDTWARMLANAADADHGAEVRRAYVSILADCTSLDVRILAKIYNRAPEERNETVVTAYLPERAVERYDNDTDQNELPVEVRQSLWNLIRLGLLSSDTPGPGEWQTFSVSITALGIGLVEACTLRDRNAPAQVEPAKTGG